MKNVPIVPVVLDVPTLTTLASQTMGRIYSEIVN
jgi:hypothetical protein